MGSGVAARADQADRPPPREPTRRTAAMADLPAAPVSVRLAGVEYPLDYYVDTAKALPGKVAVLLAASIGYMLSCSEQLFQGCAELARSERVKQLGEKMAGLTENAKPHVERVKEVVG